MYWPKIIRLVISIPCSGHDFSHNFSQNSLSMAIDQSTHGTYTSALNSYITFCHIPGFDIGPTQYTLTLMSPSNPHTSIQNLLIHTYLASPINLKHTYSMSAMLVKAHLYPMLCSV